MATAARRPCTWPGCPELVSDGGRCEQHRRQADRERGTAHQRGYTSTWRKQRDHFLRSEGNQLCVMCGDEGRIEAATVVDHIIPHKGDPALFNDRANWQPLCKACHDRKTATHDGAFGRASTPHPRGGGSKL